jgi:hypothetical protein
MKLFRRLIEHKNILASMLAILIVILISYWGIWNVFFQQDEWLGLGGAIYRKQTFGTLGSIAQVFNFSNPNEVVRFLPVTSILNYLLYSNLGINIKAYGLFSLLIALSCSLIFSEIVYKLTSSRIVGLMAAAFWVTNNLAYQAFTWIATMVPSLLTTLFFLLSLYLMLLYNDNKKRSYLISSIVLVTMSLFSKESSVFYIVTYSLLIWFLFRGKLFSREKIKLTTLFLIPLAISLIVPRLISLSFNQSNFSPSVDSANQSEIIYNLFLIPARTLSQVYLPQEKTYELAYKANTIHYSAQTNGFVVESIIAESTSLLVSFYFLLASFILVLVANVKEKKIIYISMASFLASTLPFIIFKNESAVLENRFYIFPALWASLLLSLFIYILCSRIPKVKIPVIFLIFICIVFYNVTGIHKHLKQDIKTGGYRRNILDTIAEVKPKLGQNNIFYFYTENNGFYEFQSGTGQMLATWLYDSGRIPKEALIDRDFWDLSYEGIKAYPKGKYGYFMSYDKLYSAIKENPDIKIDEVHSFYWNPLDHTVRDVSKDIQVKLSTDLTK